MAVGLLLELSFTAASYRSTDAGVAESPQTPEDDRGKRWSGAWKVDELIDWCMGEVIHDCVGLGKGRRWLVGEPGGLGY